MAALGCASCSEGEPQAIVPPSAQPTCVEHRDLELVWNQKSSAPAVVRGADLRYTADDCSTLGSIPSDLTIEESALEVLERVAPLYGVSDNDRFEVERVDRDELDYQHVRIQHRYGAHRVVGSSLIVHFDDRGRAYEINGRYRSALESSAAPAIDADAAIAAAREHLADESATATAPELVVYARGAEPALAYGVELSAGGPSRWQYFIDASNGAVLANYDTVPTEAPPVAGTPSTVTGQRLGQEGSATVTVPAWKHATNTNRYLFDQALDWSVREPGPDCESAGAVTFHAGGNWGTTDPFAISVALNLRDTIAYFGDTHGYVGWDGAGGHTIGIVRYACFQPNAFYIGNGLLAFGVGGAPFLKLGATDVVAHEFAHAVTGQTAGLAYTGESGALNESFSDIFGSVVEFSAQIDNSQAYPQTTPGRADWLIGEDAATKPLRDMRNPRNANVLTPSPSRYQGTLWKSTTDPFDSGGVHFNSGVQNFFFYLLIHGGSGDNDGITYNFAGLDRQSAARIAYRALVHYGHADSDYSDIREAWLSAAHDLSHLDLARDWVAAVAAAWTAVGVNTNFCPSWHPDVDGDGYGDPNAPLAACARPPGYVADHGDCNDNNATVFPNAPETCSDGVINACIPSADVCGQLAIAIAVPDVIVSWDSDCVLQVADSLDNPVWQDHQGDIQQTACAREAHFSTQAPMKFFRLRLP